jgi:uncharacterized protein involved in exopolysaccharide biosynthesis
MTQPRSGWTGEVLSPDLALWLALLRRQWFVVSAAFALVVVGTVVAAAWYPWKYESVAKFLVRNARQDLVVNPNDKSSGVYKEDVSEETINSEIELIRSRDILARVVRESNMEGTDANPRVALERAIAQLGGSLEVAGMRKTNLIRVAYRSRDPEQAAMVVRNLADAYLSMHLSVHSSPGTYVFFKEQSTHWRAELEQAEKELTALAGSQHLIAPEEQRKAALESGSATEDQLTEIEAQIREQTTRELAAERALTSTEERVITQRRKLPNQASVERLHTMVAELRNKRTELLTKFNADDRLVQEVDAQLQDTQAALRDATVLSATEEATDINPAWQRLQAERMGASLQLAGLRSKAERLRMQVGAFRSRAVTLAQATPQYETLLRRAADARDQYALYLRRTEEARLADALDRQKISNVVLAEAPVPALMSSRPRLAFVLLVGVIGGAMCAFAAAVASEWLGPGLAGRRLVGAYTRTAPGGADASEA